MITAVYAVIGVLLLLIVVVLAWRAIKFILRVAIVGLLILVIMAAAWRLGLIGSRSITIRERPPATRRSTPR